MSIVPHVASDNMSSSHSMKGIDFANCDVARDTATFLTSFQQKKNMASRLATLELVVHEINFKLSVLF